MRMNVIHIVILNIKWNYMSTVLHVNDIFRHYNRHFNRFKKQPCRDQDSNLGYCGHNAVS